MNTPKRFRVRGQPTHTAEQDPVELTDLAIKQIDDFQSRAHAEKARFRRAVDSEYWVCFCFQTQEQKMEFLLKADLIDLGDKHINGLLAAQELGIEIESESPEWKDGKINERLRRLA